MKLKTNPSTNHGTAVLVVITIVALLGVLAVANSRMLFFLKKEIQMVEKEQLKKYQPQTHPIAAPQKP
jgi:type II secretory pathway component PulK